MISGVVVWDAGDVLNWRGSASGHFWSRGEPIFQKKKKKNVKYFFCQRGSPRDRGCSDHDFFRFSTLPVSRVAAPEIFLLVGLSLHGNFARERGNVIGVGRYFGWGG